MNIVDRQLEQVYHYIWDYLVEREELPTARLVAEALDMSQEQVQHDIRLLRAQKRLCRTTLKPTAYDAWWRENIRLEQRWAVKPLIPLRRLQEKQLKLPLPME